MSESNPYMMVGERLCMDYINTVSWRESAQKRSDWFTSYAKLVDWSIHADVLTERQAQELIIKAEEKPAESAHVLNQAIELREVMYRIFRTISMEQEPLQEEIELFNVFVRQYYQLLQLSQEKDHFLLEFKCSKNPLEGMLPPILQSAVDLLVSKSDFKRVKRCEGDLCGWLFFDTSRNRSRRWCSMADCGNRAKARRFYQKDK
ncbi:CGNR zinc finger domain-containing protein [Metabacillus arenae]|uniref:CGNR zinc finger domain-containing protein n=1 Tax=Metabacillus arenae TaxID=2771434 RepID=A0A926NIA9_9BACI|nr:CGNR zinc finger domain-containing protein [Metabacillus arenae]MBD1382209.1 CGNR zinc finger domain-containing protein [Metabacillus arenae]